MFEFNNKKIVYVLACICFIITFILIAFSKGTYDPGDGVQHYLIAKYALQHPLLLLDHWGKPIFTLLCMPFAQIGFIGSNIYNLICNTITSIIAFQIAQKLGLKNAAVAFILVFFSPLFYVTNYSGLTEPTFALILLSAICLLLYDKFVVGSLLISCLPFARTEGFFILPLFGIYLFLKNQWKAIPLLCSASLVYSLIGYFVLHDFFWILHQNPYTGAFEIYGQGPLLHFVAANDRLFGLPLVVLFLLGCICLFQKKAATTTHNTAFFILIIGSFGVYFTLHSIFWWKGLFGSLGLHRVMAAVAPLFSLVALLGFNVIEVYFSTKVKLQKLVLVSLLIIVAIYPFKQYKPPIKPNTEIEVLRSAANWIKQNEISVNNKVYCMYPYLSMLLHVDIFNSEKYASTCMLKYSDFNSTLLPGDLILWDSHFGNECGYSPKDIALLPHVKKLASFSKVQQSNQLFEVHIFIVTQ